MATKTPGVTEELGLHKALGCLGKLHQRFTWHKIDQAFKRRYQADDACRPRRVGVKELLEVEWLGPNWDSDESPLSLKQKKKGKAKSYPPSPVEPEAEEAGQGELNGHKRLWAPRG
ncbi:hypothetical protein ColKHC_06640 [Colletotrichum higginsianum]|nr:hypothetical protein ColKHC_06640 [Colletotrichum higginsianum]